MAFKNPSSINPTFKLSKKKLKEVSFYLDGLSKGDRFVLSECITLLESQNIQKRNLGESILSAISPTQKSIRIGITGTPGVGKSTFIEAFGLHLIAKGLRVAVTAIDPSSQKTGGSILGDKTRMEQLSISSHAFIRPTAAGNVLGGTAQNTKEVITLCEAAGFDIVIVETVGVGQSETEVDNITDVNLLLLQPGAGDEMQGIKRGIVENADIFIINKADGTQKELAKRTKQYYLQAIQLFHHQLIEWTCPVLLCSSLESEGLEEIYEAIQNYITLSKSKGFFDQQRQLQETKWFENQTMNHLKLWLFNQKTINDEYQNLLRKINENQISTAEAIIKMQATFQKYFGK